MRSISQHWQDKFLSFRTLKVGYVRAGAGAGVSVSSNFVAGILVPGILVSCFLDSGILVSNILISGILFSFFSSIAALSDY